MKSVLEIRDGDSYQPLYVPDTPYVIELEVRNSIRIRITIGGNEDSLLSSRAMNFFYGHPIDAYTMRRIGCWLREGAPESFVP